jgi:hypothetical protein
MMSEQELRETHRRLVKVLAYAKAAGVHFGVLKDLIAIKVGLEWVLGMNTAAARDWQAATFKAIQNLEGLQRAAARSRLEAEN